jgi:hypothetical protein
VEEHATLLEHVLCKLEKNKLYAYWAKKRICKSRNGLFGTCALLKRVGSKENGIN